MGGTPVPSGAGRSPVWLCRYLSFFCYKTLLVLQEFQFSVSDASFVDFCTIQVPYIKEA